MTSRSADPLRRGPLQRWHEAHGASHAMTGGGATPMRYADETPDPPALGLCDLSMLPRLGVKGWRAWDRLAEIGIARPAANNSGCGGPDGVASLRLGDTEALLLAGLDGDAPVLGRLAAMDDADGFYVVPRRDTHAWFLLAGAAAPEMMARICAVDLRPGRFATWSVAQTTVARVSAIVMRRDLGATPALDLLTDTASAAYLWSALLRTAAPLGGRPIGLASARAMNGPDGRGAGPNHVSSSDTSRRP